MKFMILKSCFYIWVEFLLDEYVVEQKCVFDIEETDCVNMKTRIRYEPQIFNFVTELPVRADAFSSSRNLYTINRLYYKT